MTDPNHDDRFRRLIARIAPGATLRGARRLIGGVSAEVTVLDLGRTDGGPTTMIVRRHGETDRRQHPRVARDEFALLRLAHARGLPVPEPYHLDESGDLFPHPFLVIGYVDGETVFDPADPTDYVTQAAAQLAAIHAIPDGPDLAFLPRHGRGFGERPVALDTALGEDRIREALESGQPSSGGNPPVLLHGDFWPGNLLWRDGRLVAVIDWEDARVGDPLADLGNTRLELLWALGPKAMAAFTDHYRSLTALDWTTLPHWDLCAALRPCGKLAGWGLDAETEHRWRALHAHFVDQALTALPGR